MISNENIEIGWFFFWKY